MANGALSVVRGISRDVFRTDAMVGWSSASLGNCTTRSTLVLGDLERRRRQT